MRGKRILVVDDNPALQGLLQLTFSRVGAEVYVAKDGQQGLDQFFVCRPHLVILDVLMPGMDGWETCRALRRFSDVPIIFLTAVEQEKNIVRALNCGAVDYVTKPFSPEVLLARARAILRRIEAAVPAEPASYDDGYLAVDTVGRQVRVQGKPVKLTTIEYALLAYLVENAGHTLTHKQILTRVWGSEYADSINYVHVYMSYLRRKVERDPHQPVYLLAERGVGYRFEKRFPASTKPDLSQTDLPTT